jgi:hypothetical protein
LQKEELKRMSIKGAGAVGPILLAAVLFAGCNLGGANQSGGANQAGANANGGAAKAAASPAKLDADGAIPSGEGVEKEKPEAGKGNVQGKVLYNGQPASGIEVKLCEKFSRFVGGCGGETFTAKTDASGEYLIKGVPPRTYEALTAKVFNTDYYVFATSGIVSAAKYKIEEGKTYFAPDTHLFKQDLKLTSPKAGSKLAPEGIEVKWDAYPDAAYYKMSVFADTSTGAQPNYDYINRRIDGLSFALDKPLGPGSYNVRVEAFNGSDQKLSQSSNDIKFTVTGGAPAPATK